MPAHPWDRASQLTVMPDGRPRPETVALPAGRPTVEALFSFMRDAELRFATLRMRIEERSATTDGERLVATDVLLRHPLDARVTTSEPGLGTKGTYEIWISDGTTVRTYSATHRLGTERPVRRRLVGLGDPDLPASSKVYRPVTPLPTETLPEAFVHPAGLCQNVLATGDCRVSGTDVVAGREALVLECDHPRGTEVWADRPDHRLTVWVDRETGVITRLVETIGGETSRDATVVLLEPDAVLPPSAFDFELPPDTATIF
jgi:outer membrane lipoprotein-sorting protein